MALSTKNIYSLTYNLTVRYKINRIGFYSFFNMRTVQKMQL